MSKKSCEAAESAESAVLRMGVAELLQCLEGKYHDKRSAINFTGITV